jgi:hypothetical protein
MNEAKQVCDKVCDKVCDEVCDKVGDKVCDEVGNGGGIYIYAEKGVKVLP